MAYKLSNLFSHFADWKIVVLWLKDKIIFVQNIFGIHDFLWSISWPFFKTLYMLGFQKLLCIKIHSLFISIFLELHELASSRSQGLRWSSARWGCCLDLACSGVQHQLCRCSFLLGWSQEADLQGSACIKWEVLQGHDHKSDAWGKGKPVFPLMVLPSGTWQCQHVLAHMVEGSLLLSIGVRSVIKWRVCLKAECGPQQWTCYFYVVCCVLLAVPWVIPLCPLQALRGTVTAFPGFDARADAETLRKAMKGLGNSACFLF